MLHPAPLKQDSPEIRPISSQQRSLLVEFVRLLDLKSYADMSKSNPHADRLKSLEAELCAAFCEPSDCHLDLKRIPTNVFVDFLVAYALEASLPLTVGSLDDLASSFLSRSELEELSAFQLRSVPPSVRQNVIETLAEEYGLRADELAAVREQILQAEESLSQRRKVVAALRQCLFPDGTVCEASTKAAFDRMYPGNPMLAHEVEVVATASAIYWKLPPKDQIRADSRRSAEHADTTREFIELLTGFRTSNFRQFPAFHAYDLRVAQKGVIDAVAVLTGYDPVQVCNLVKRSVWIEATADIRLYIIHDTWGHVWQGDFSGLAGLYEAAHFAMTPLSRLLPCAVGGRMITREDLLGGSELVPYPAPDIDLILWCAEQRLLESAHLIVTPITAELMADIAEFKFCIDALAASPPIRPLPSSSLFGYRPAKMDFGWVSPLYFSSQCCKALKTGLSEVLSEVHNSLVLLTSVVEKLQSRKCHLDGLDVGRLSRGGESESLLEQLFIQVVRIFATVNMTFEVQSNAKLSAHIPLLILALARIFSNHPREEFWHLDRHVATTLPSLIRRTTDCENTLTGEGH